MIHDDNARQTKCMLLVLIISKIWHIMKRGDTGYFRTSCSTSDPAGRHFCRHRVIKNPRSGVDFFRAPDGALLHDMGLFCRFVAINDLHNLF